MSVVTNTTPISAYRGAGRPEATAAIERAVDLFAAEIGMDPAKVRQENLIESDAFPYSTPTGLIYDSGDYATAPARVLDEANYDSSARSSFAGVAREGRCSSASASRPMSRSRMALATRAKTQ